MSKRKIKEMIGRDLARDNIGTNQLLDYNNLINVIGSSDVKYDESRYKKYHDNLKEQKKINSMAVIVLNNMN